ncbi:MAG: hypothetical protein COA96_07310 [SAR86 cluster bacterium]|uniref:Membrane fusion protein biotin-lipoyl like domain-containing protein n=1 Tax=SAR86 cluster bacterium TaxID=2030880 RepID=A0A2A5B1T5_9GAMM|nr:MAG: hypothetical protein COA96_07310 [SAR86 cluster bacterium]
MLAALILLTRTNYRETLPARGVLEPGQGVQKIVSPSAAVLKSVYVEAGDIVSKGQPLASLSTSVFDRSGRPIQEAQVDQLTSTQELLSQEMSVQEKLYIKNKSRNHEEIEGLQVRNQNLTAEMALLATQLTLSNTNLEALQYLLDNSNISQADFDQRHASHLGLRLQREALLGRMQEVSSKLTGLASVEEVIEFEYERDRLVFQKETDRLDYEIQRALSQGSITVLAQDNGIVAAVAVGQGESVRSSQPLFYINPENDRLRAIVYVPARVHGRLYPGQQIMLSYDAFDYQIYGRYNAIISSLSQASLDPREQLLPVSGINEPVFRVEASLEQEYVDGPELYRLQSGMQLSADFVVSEMPLLMFIFKPLLGLRGKIW